MHFGEFLAAKMLLVAVFFTVVKYDWNIKHVVIVLMQNDTFAPVERWVLGLCCPFGVGAYDL